MSLRLGFEIERTDANDLGAVMTVMEEAFDPQFGEAWTVTQCESILMLPGSWLMIARVGQDPAAFALVRSVANEAELLLIATRPCFQQRTIGRSMITHLISECKSSQINVLHLEVRADNPALSFYGHAGFIQVGTRKNYYHGAFGRKTDAITLSLQIT
jgi:[ribosomal protein S18]-alanine N-acetyltransferase